MTIGTDMIESEDATRSDSREDALRALYAAVIRACAERDSFAGGPGLQALAFAITAVSESGE